MEERSMAGRVEASEIRSPLMKRYATLALSLLLLTSILLAQPPSIELPKPDDSTARATAFLDLLVKGDFQTAAQRCAEPMKASTVKLAGIWTSLQAQRGPYKRRIATRTVKEGLYDVVLATTEFERGTVDLKVLVNERGRIAGFFIAPADGEPTPAPADPG